MKTVSLYFCAGNSDKEYHIQLVQAAQNNGRYVVNFQYGRRGNALQHGTKTSTPVSLEEGEKIFNKLMREKEGKGYVSEDGIKSTIKSSDDEIQETVPVRSKEIHMLPQLLNDVEDPQTYINDDSYIAQEKKDGERRPVTLTDQYKAKGFNKKGQEVPLPDSIIKSINRPCTLDGEIIGNKLFVFDILELHGESIKDKKCVERLKILDSLNFGEGIEVVKTAYTKKEKQALYDKLKKDNAEGIVFKKKNAAYTSGRLASGGNSLKHKFYKEATFIVKDLTKGKRSVELELITEGGGRVFVGKVTIPPNKEIPNQGDFVEVRYLYAYPGGSIFQGVYKEKRNDCDLTDANIKQLVYKAEIEA